MEKEGPKKVKLYGEKKIFGLFKKRGFVAEIWVENGTVRIESRNKKLKKELEKITEELIKNNEVTIGKRIERKEPGYARVYTEIDISQKPGDKFFLVGLASALEDFSRYRRPIQKYEFFFSRSQFE